MSLLKALEKVRQREQKFPLIRLTMMLRLKNGAATTNKLSEEFYVTIASVSRNLDTLLREGYVVREEFFDRPTYKFRYSLTPKGDHRLEALNEFI